LQAANAMAFYVIMVDEVIPLGMEIGPAMFK
jgi:hypothetical protein